MRTSRYARRNAEFIVGIMFGMYFLFVAVSHYHAADEYYQSTQPFESGLMASAKIIKIPENSRGETPVSVRYTDHQRKVRDASTLVRYPEYLRVGQSVEISYRPDSPDRVRAPALGWSASEYDGWRGMCIVWIVGALSLLPFLIWRRFREPPVRPAVEFDETDFQFVLKRNYLRLFIVWAVYAFALFMIYAIVTLQITHFLGLPLWLQKVAVFVWHGLLAYKIGLPAVRMLTNDPLKITFHGMSFYGRPAVPWSDMSQILLFRGRTPSMESRLVIALNDSSETKGVPVWQIPLRALSPVVYLNLYGARWDDYDMIKAICHFGLEARDPEAAKHLMSSLTESGLINPHKFEESEADVVTRPLKDNSYMSGGFHFGHR